MKGVMGSDEKSFPLSLFFLPITFHLHSALVPIISHTLGCLLSLGPEACGGGRENCPWNQTWPDYKALKINYYMHVMMVECVRSRILGATSQEFLSMSQEIVWMTVSSNSYSWRFPKFLLSWIWTPWNVQSETSPLVNPQKLVILYPKK